MPLIPAIVAAISGGAALAKGLPAIVGTPQERANRKRIKELEEMGDAMGLTPAERAEMEAGYAGGIEQTQQAADRKINAALANGGGGSGQALARAGQAHDQTTDAIAAAAHDVNRADAQRRTELEQELEERYGFQSATRKARVGAVAGIPAAAATGYLQGENQAAELGLRGGAAGATADRVAKIAALAPADLERLRALMLERGLDTSELPPPAGG